MVTKEYFRNYYALNKEKYAVASKKYRNSEKGKAATIRARKNFNRKHRRKNE